MENRKLSPEQFKKALDWVQSKTSGANTCPVCKTTNWSLYDEPVAPVIFKPGSGLDITGPQYVFIMCICKNCAHTIFFNGTRMGLFPPAGGKNG